ncbi:MAG: hypothetical protein A3J24_00590 [Deltaproteobacteria bacterium RIFCSPLOWO2_02_FULL_53_8]|nr:MAG: hypothetical protein A3J24_00590 [Deltaproteobacteria bacterium RIFCSPLOWO2_02_FULL_53_8]
MIRFISALLLVLVSLAGSVQAGTLTFTTYYHNDHLGSPVAATDESNELLWRAHFRPYGERQENPSDSAFGTPGYTGHAQDKDSGLVYAGARYYDPMVGRFMAVDPVGVDPGSPGSFNRYAYANNNPHRYVDPNGESAVTAFGGVLHETGQFLTGNGFDGAMVVGALADGYNGDGGGFAAAAFEDATSFIPAGAAAGGLIKLSRLAKASKVTKSAGDFFKAGRTPKASELQKYAEGQGWKPVRTDGGPLKYVDENGIPRVTIKQGSSRAPGSGNPHVELKDASGQRIDPSGNPVTRKSPGNHTPINYDL